ncbi:hypothetical protein PUN28_004870 [Cardiocondyla obscurior]|uniref:Uncharacterized protein n=1 Tax=Cardiocondyla obscurior TaxID=286306 RepID=A0AAW2GDE9_9HYME
MKDSNAWKERASSRSEHLEVDTLAATCGRARESRGKLKRMDIYNNICVRTDAIARGQRRLKKATHRICHSEWPGRSISASFPAPALPLRLTWPARDCTGLHGCRLLLNESRVLFISVKKKKLVSRLLNFNSDWASYLFIKFLFFFLFFFSTVNVPIFLPSVSKSFVADNQ